MSAKGLVHKCFRGYFHTGCKCSNCNDHPLVPWSMDEQSTANPCNGHGLTIKRKKLLISTRYLHLKNWRSYYTREGGLAWFYLYAIIGEAKQSLLTESTPGVAWAGCMQVDWLQRGIRGILGGDGNVPYLVCGGFRGILIGQDSLSILT